MADPQRAALACVRRAEIQTYLGPVRSAVCAVANHCPGYGRLCTQRLIPLSSY